MEVWAGDSPGARGEGSLLLGAVVGGGEPLQLPGALRASVCVRATAGAGLLFQLRRWLRRCYARRESGARLRMCRIPNDWSVSRPCNTAK